MNDVVVWDANRNINFKFIWIKKQPCIKDIIITHSECMLNKEEDNNNNDKTRKTATVSTDTPSKHYKHIYL